MNDKIIDFHTHAFPDDLAPRAMKKLSGEAPGIAAYLDGTTGELLDSMENNNIEKSVVCAIATRPNQFDTIFDWCKTTRSDRLVMFPSIHPQDCQLREKIRLIKKEGFKGVKLHPFYQDFYLDEDRMLNIYQMLCEEDLIVVIHTGFDIAFPRIRRADCSRILNVMSSFPRLKLITTHLGAWDQWDEVERQLIGREIYMDISFSLEYLEPQKARRMIAAHPANYILFATDSPWTDQGRTLNLLKNLNLSADTEKKILWENALSLLAPA